MAIVKVKDGLHASIQTYVNVSAGLLYKTEVRIPCVLHKVLGKTCAIENAEMNTLIIDGTYYEIVGYYGPLAHVVEVQ